jgi:hypothetical protein
MKEVIENGSHNGYEIQSGQLIVNVWHASSPEREKFAAKLIERAMKVACL